MPDPGDYLTTELGIDSVILVRQDNGSVRAFLNSCPHRGTRITEAEDGHAQAFSCPYHGWKFDLSGVVTSVPDEEDFAESPCGKARLKEVQCEERFGSSGITLTPTPIVWCRSWERPSPESLSRIA